MNRINQSVLCVLSLCLIVSSIGVASAQTARLELTVSHTQDGASIATMVVNGQNVVPLRKDREFWVNFYATDLRSPPAVGSAGVKSFNDAKVGEVYVDSKAVALGPEQSNPNFPNLKLPKFVSVNAKNSTFSSASSKSVNHTLSVPFPSFPLNGSEEFFAFSMKFKCNNNPDGNSNPNDAYTSNLVANPSSVSFWSGTDSTNMSIIRRFVRVGAAGDTNLDGDVDFADFLVLAANFGMSGKTWQHGDFDYNGTVDFGDFLALSANFEGDPSGLQLP